MNIATEKRGEVTVIHLGGEVLIADVENFEKEIRDLRSSGSKLVVIDFAGIDSCPTVLVGSLVAFAREFDSQGGRLALASVNLRMLSMLKRLALEEFFTIHDSTDMAVSALTPKAHGPPMKPTSE